SFMHGFGIQNIDRIVQMYGGYCERELKNHVFRCRIRIPGK
ncbi:MAG: ATP-binding protein, partial [Lachnospiraceae bacterium]|nr:ATP-binding protein [Lachnospiraceae bacterium]